MTTDAVSRPRWPLSFAAPVLAAVAAAAGIPAQQARGERAGAGPQQAPSSEAPSSETQDPALELARIDRQFAADLAEWAAQQRARLLAGDDGSSRPLPLMPSKRSLDQCLQAAERHGRSAAAAPYLIWALRHAIDERTVVRSAVRRLAEVPGAGHWQDALLALPRVGHLLGDDELQQVISAANASGDAGALASARLIGLLHACRSAGADLPFEALGELADDEALGEAGRALARRLATAAVRSHDADAHVTLDDYESAVVAAWATDRLLLVNFSGRNCATCRVMEDEFWTAEPVRTALRDGFVEARLSIDDQPSPERTAHLQRQDRWMATRAVPGYVAFAAPSAAPVRVLTLRGAPPTWQARFEAFLADARVAAGR